MKGTDEWFRVELLSDPWLKGLQVKSCMETCRKGSKKKALQHHGKTVFDCPPVFTSMREATVSQFDPLCWTIAPATLCSLRKKSNLKLRVLVLATIIITSSLSLSLLYTTITQFLYSILIYV